jgi:hypothetical protein
MKISNLIIKPLGMLFFLSLMINAQSNTGLSQDNSGSKTKSFNVNKGGTLDVQISTGDIKIAVWDKNEVNIKIASEDKEDINSINATLENNTVKIRNNYSSWSGLSGDISLSISIPSEFNVDINTQSGDVTQNGSLKGTANIFTAGGDIIIGDVSGRTNLKSNGGDITTGNIGNELTLSTNGGNVKTGVISGKLSINTMGGSVNVNKADEDLTINTMGGDINIGNVGGAADVKTMGGSIGIGKVSGKANINTYGGDISLAGATGNVEANTYGGNINLKNINGSVNADTKSGNVYVELNPSAGNSKIKSLNGNVVLYLPTNAKVNITATVIARHYDRRNENAEMMKLIHSDFNSVDLTNVDLHDNKITAKYSINGGGKNYIEISTINGSIQIKKK